MKLIKLQTIAVSIIVGVFIPSAIAAGKEVSVEKTNDSGSLDLGKRILPVPRHASFQDEGWFTWGGSMVKGDDEKYYLFYSRWPYKEKMKGWRTHSQIACAVADNPTGPYKFHSVAMKGRGEGYFDGTTVHNPHIHKFGEMYYLYYLGASAKKTIQDTGKTQRIGVAVSRSVNGPWKRQEEPLIDVTAGSFDSDFVTNPSVARKDDTYIMVYKCLGKEGKFHGVAFAKSPTGPFVKHKEPIFTHKTSKAPAEDPFLFNYKNTLYTVLSDNRGAFTGVKQALCLFTSKDGINWHPAKHLLISERMIQWEDGRKEKLADLERPQIYFDEDGEPAVLFCAATRTRRAPGKTFNIHIPLKKVLPQNQSSKE
jgi:hypothetical protein